MSDEHLTQRQRDAKKRAELTANAARAEAARAQTFIDEFVATTTEQGPAPHPLKATTMDGVVVKTDKVGWYLRTNKSLAIDTDGNYYSLVVPAGFMARFRGVQLVPTLATMQIGKGGRDGETGDLREFLAWVLDGTIPQD